MSNITATSGVPRTTLLDPASLFRGDALLRREALLRGVRFSPPVAGSAGLGCSASIGTNKRLATSSASVWLTGKSPFLPRTVPTPQPCGSNSKTPIVSPTRKDISVGLVAVKSANPLQKKRGTTTEGFSAKKSANKKKGKTHTWNRRRLVSHCPDDIRNGATKRWLGWTALHCRRARWRGKYGCRRGRRSTYR